MTLMEHTTHPADIDPRRAVAVAGSRNFRDLGGYATSDGRQIGWGLLYRSGSLGGVTAEGVEALRALGLKGLCDLRTSHERLTEPVVWAEPMGLSYWSRDYETSFGELRRLMEADLPDREATRAAMLHGYRRLPFEQAPAYRELFRRLADGALPLVFNCSAGKDRAGTAAALILTALGVPRETVLADYALTDRLVDLAKLLARPKEGGLLARQPPEVVHAILSADPDYMAAALDSVAPTEAAFKTYLNDVLAIDQKMLGAIRDQLLERP
jgi:protein-tyrosine phosphatase